MAKGTLIFFAGKMGAGKSTKANDIAQQRNAVLLSEDEWLASLYPGQISSLDDYIRYSAQLRPQIRKLVQSMLAAGTDVVMDFPANTPRQRQWFTSIFNEAGAPHQLIYIEATNELCLQRIAGRRLEQPERAATDTESMFEQVTQYFVEPAAEEGLNIIRLAEDEAR